MSTFALVAILMWVDYALWLLSPLLCIVVTIAVGLIFAAIGAQTLRDRLRPHKPQQ